MFVDRVRKASLSHTTTSATAATKCRESLTQCGSTSLSQTNSREQPGPVMWVVGTTRTGASPNETCERFLETEQRAGESASLGCQRMVKLKLKLRPVKGYIRFGPGVEGGGCAVLFANLPSAYKLAGRGRAPAHAIAHTLILNRSIAAYQKFLANTISRSLPDSLRITASNWSSRSALVLLRRKEEILCCISRFIFANEIRI